MKFIKKLRAFMALSCCALVSPVYATLDVDKEQVLFTLQDQSNLSQQVNTVTIVNNYATAVDLTGTISVVRDDNTTDNITYVDSSCQQTIAAGSECYLVFTYDQLDHNLQGMLLEVSDPNSTEVFPIFAANYFDQTTATQAARRLAPVVESVQVFADTDTSFSTPLTGTLDQGTYSVRWTVLAYEELKGKAVIYDCGLTANADDNCAVSEFDSDKIDNSTTMSATVLSVHNFTDYNFKGEVASHQQFTASLTIPANSFDDGEHVLALRFFHRTVVDSSDGISKNISSILAGSLNFMNQADIGYYSTDGRRLTVKTPNP